MPNRTPSPDPDRPPPRPAFPWTARSPVAAATAMAAVAERLRAAIERDGRLHVPTLLVAAGALAGRAAREAARDGPVAPEGAPDLSPWLAPRRRTEGAPRRPTEDAPPLSIADLVCAAAMLAGAGYDALPDRARAVPPRPSAPGGSGPAATRLPGADPSRWTPAECLDAMWAPVREILSRVPPAAASRGEPPLGIADRPVLLGVVAARAIAHTAGAIDPAAAATLVLEAAWLGGGGADRTY